MPMKQIMENLLDSTVSKAPTFSGSPSLSASDDGERRHVQFRGGNEPQLIADWEGYNLVRYARRIYALRQGLGEVDVSDNPQTLIGRYGAGAVVIADTIDEARARVRALLNEAPKEEN